MMLSNRAITFRRALNLAGIVIVSMLYGALLGLILARIAKRIGAE